MEKLKNPSVMLFEQIRCIDKTRLREYIGHYEGNFDEEIKISLGL
jgi:mRNA-degrading endonuclease toxin of MazEF toxin-antitoxin module